MALDKTAAHSRVPEPVKGTKNEDDLREYRHLRNLCHKQLSKDKHDNQKEAFEKASKDPKLQWKEAKQALGWTKSKSPQVIISNGKVLTSPKIIANEMNRGFIEKNIHHHRSIPPTNTDPLANYTKLTQGKDLNFRITAITMMDLNKLVKSMKASNSSAKDMITMKTIKKLYKVLQYPLLNLINTIINTAEYPSPLKISKIVPILKGSKPPNQLNSYRAINLLPTISKIVDKVVHLQVLEHLVKNNLIPHEHHGGILGNTTTTAVATMLDIWSKALENQEDLAIIILDQTAAYDIIYHPILINKMEKLGFDNHTLNYFKNYLKDRRQQVTLDGQYSHELHSGPFSVIQGSVLSCLLFLIYTLDIPVLFLETTLKIEEYINNKQPKPTTFVDDVTVPIIVDPQTNNQELINHKMDQIEDYMNSNKLLLNRDKTTLLVITDKPNIRETIYLKAEPKNVTPSRGFTYLGIEISDNLKWNYWLEDSPKNLINQLKKRIIALRLLKKYVSFKMMKVFANGIFLSKLLYGAELWGGAPQYLKKKIQSLLLEAARVCLGLRVSNRWGTNRLLKEMNWLNLEKYLLISSSRITHSIIHKQRPVLLAYKMKPNWVPGDPITRLSGPYKLGPRPRKIGRTLKTKYHFKSKAYEFWSQIPPEVQQIQEPHLFKKWLKRVSKKTRDRPPERKKNEHQHKY